MMELLITNPRQIISTERFMEKIWGYDSEAEIGVVWYIFRISESGSSL